MSQETDTEAVPAAAELILSERGPRRLRVIAPTKSNES